MNTTHCSTYVGSFVGYHYTLSNIWLVTGTLSDSWFVVHWCMKTQTDTDHTFSNPTIRKRSCSIGLSIQPSGNKSCMLRSSCSAGSKPYKRRNYTTIRNIINISTCSVRMLKHNLTSPWENCLVYKH